MQRLPGIAAGYKVARDAQLVPDRGRLARELAANLARIHAVSPCRELDFLKPSLARDNIAHYRAYLDTLDEPYPVLEWGLRWCERNAPRSEETTFIHRDYRTGNYLVEDGSLTGVLDWEFACAGPPLIDVGIFLRAGNSLPAGFRDAFVAAYRDGGGWLPEEWLQLSRLVDLVSQVTFLDSEVERPRVFAESIAVIEETLLVLA